MDENRLTAIQHSVCLMSVQSIKGLFLKFHLIYFFRSSFSFRYGGKEDEEGESGEEKLQSKRTRK